jgi:MinD-like ATPase involved in chromosome partitioning or flagellar assembly
MSVTSDPESAPAGEYRIAPLRLAAALGDPERERALLPHLSQAEDFVVAARCLSAEELLAAVRGGDIDIALVASDLHRLGPAVLADLGRMPLRVVLLAPDPDGPGWESAGDAVLPLDIEPGLLIDAILVAARGERPKPRATSHQAAYDAAVTARPGAASSLVLALTSGPGSPGRTTVALNLAAGLGAVAPTILVDADLAGPSLAACLDADPTRNLAMLAHTDPDTPHAWERAIADETQPIGPRSPHGRVLCGVPKPEMQSLLSRRFLDRLVDELAMRYRYVLLDVGAEGLRGETALHRLALAAAHHTLFVTSADLLGLFRARTALARLQPDSWQDRLALVVNRYDARSHHPRAEIEWTLGTPIAAIVPFDHRAVERALAAQRPLVLEGRSRAARALLDLAERVHGGSITLPPDPAQSPVRRWWRPGLPFGWRQRPAATGQTGSP